MHHPKSIAQFKLILTAPNPSLFDAFREYFAPFPDVEIINDRFEWIPIFDCLVSPANFFGMMDGGMDAAITQFFGLSLECRVKERILEEYLGEQPVGTSFIIETGHLKHPFLAHTPTMRVPMSLKDTDVPYVAMWAMLLAIRQHNKTHPRPIASVVCPGLGTGIGQVPLAEAARQMAIAYDHFLYPPKVLNTFVAASRQLQIWEYKLDNNNMQLLKAPLQRCYI
jgi:O-acetyl-ADP-ribose deacetylase (regulator of RNase III)